MLFKASVKTAKARSNFIAQSVFTSIYILFIVLSFRGYFFFLPNFSRTHQIIAYVQVFTTLGWIFLILLPPIALWKWSDWGKFGPSLLLIGALWWPVSTLAIKLLNFSFDGNPYVAYLVERPIFLLMEYIIPGFYLYVWRKKRSQR